MTLNAAASRAAKDAGQQLALSFDADWKDRILLELRGWLAIHKAKGFSTMTFEQFRHEAKNAPASHKAWGALPKIACAAGLISPMNHPDGSPVMRQAESVKTHGHHVRVWAVASSFSSPAAGTDSPSAIEALGAAAARRNSETVGVGECRHSGNADALLQATADYHRQREQGEARA